MIERWFVHHRARAAQEPKGLDRSIQAGRSSGLCASRDSPVDVQECPPPEDWHRWPALLLCPPKITSS